MRVAAGFPAEERGPSVTERARQARDKRLASEAAPARRSEPGTWLDPDDTGTGTRTPKTIKGRRRTVGVVARLYGRGSAEISRSHVEAAAMLGAAWDGSRIGYSARSMTGESTGRGSIGPMMGPPAAATRQAADAATVQRAFRAVGVTAIPLVRFVLLDNGDLSAWCALQAGLTGRKPCPKCSLGRLLSCLDRLIDVFGLPHEARQDQRQASASPG